MNNSIYLGKSRLHQTEDYGRTYLPKLVAETTFQHTADRAVPRRLSKSEESAKRNSLEPVARARSLSTSYISLPHIVSYRELVSQSHSRTSSLDTRDIHSNAETSDQSDNDDDDDGVHISIDPYPNVGVESFLNSYTFPDIPPTPPRRRKRKEIKIKPKQENETKKRQKRTKTNKIRRWSQSDRALQRELARKHPVKKQFLYSELMEEELKSHIPKRLPGGKLKPIYKRTTEGDIFVPSYPLNINLERLNIKENENISLSGSASDINKFRKQELKEMLEKRKKIQLQKLKRRKKRVRFVLPSGHVDSEESDSDNQSRSISRGSTSDRGSTSEFSQTITKANDDPSEHDVIIQTIDEELEDDHSFIIKPNSETIEHHNETNDNNDSLNGSGGSKLNDQNDLNLTGEDSNDGSDTTSAMLKLPVIKDVKPADQTEDDTVTIVDSYRFRISKANGSTIKYTRIDS